MKGAAWTIVIGRETAFDSVWARLAWTDLGNVMMLGQRPEILVERIHLFFVRGASFFCDALVHALFANLFELALGFGHLSAFYNDTITIDSIWPFEIMLTVVRRFLFR